MDRLFLGVVRLRKTAQKHCRSGDVLVSPSKLWGIVPPIHDVALEPAGVTPSATHEVMRARHNMLRRAHRRRWWLVLLPLS